jgi:hypothetical protein
MVRGPVQGANGSYTWQVAYHLDEAAGNPLAATLQQLYPRSVTRCVTQQAPCSNGVRAAGCLALDGG